MNPPYMYEPLNYALSAYSPSTIHTSNNVQFNYYLKYLIQYAIAQFDWNIPTNWDKDYFLYTLYGVGYLAIIKTDRFGVIPQQCSLRGLNVFYHPTEALIANPLLPGYRAQKIDKECVVIKLQPDYSTIMDKVAFYADMMALCDEITQVNLFNSQLSYVMAAQNKTIAESFKKLYDVIHSGNPAVVTDKQLMNSDGSPTWQAFNNDVGKNFIVDKIQTVKETIKDQFLTDLGIPNANTQKRERLITDEVTSNRQETAIITDMWLTHLKEDIEKANKMFNINMNVDWRFKPVEGSENNAGNVINYGAVYRR